MSNSGNDTLPYDEQVQVLIAGGSLVGLSAAVFLQHNGIQSLVVERHPAPARLPRARAINPRTMELFRALGLEETMRAAQSPIADYTLMVRVESLAGTEIERLFEGDFGDEEVASPTSWCSIDQDQLEPILVEHAQKLGCALHFNTELVSFEQDEQGVTAVIRERATGQERRVRASYLLGADGNRSTVRDTLGITTQGPGLVYHSTNIVFEADLHEAERGRRIMLCYISNPELPDGQGFLMPIDGQKRWQLSIALHPERGERREDFTDEYGLKLIRLATGIPDLEAKIVQAYPWDPVKVGVWEMMPRYVEQYQSGRVFLAGDSAHAILPTGAMGASTGIQDAFNLAWKLALVLKGQATPALLTSYAEERTPIGQLMVEQTMQRFAHRVGNDASSLIDNASLIFGYRYRHGAFIAEPGAEKASLTQKPGTLSGEPGTRAPHVWLERAGERLSTIDLFGRSFVLLSGAEGASWHEAAQRVAARLALKLDSCQIGAQGLQDVDSRWQAAYGVSAAGASLVRPDGFVAWRSRDGVEDAEATLEQVLLRLLGRTTA